MHRWAVELYSFCTCCFCALFVCQWSRFLFSIFFLHLCPTFTHHLFFRCRPNKISCASLVWYLLALTVLMCCSFWHWSYFWCHYIDWIILDLIKISKPGTLSTFRETGTVSNSLSSAKLKLTFSPEVRSTQTRPPTELQWETGTGKPITWSYSGTEPQLLPSLKLRTPTAQQKQQVFWIAHKMNTVACSHCCAVCVRSSSAVNNVLIVNNQRLIPGQYLNSYHECLNFPKWFNKCVLTWWYMQMYIIPGQPVSFLQNTFCHV